MSKTPNKTSFSWQLWLPVAAGILLYLTSIGHGFVLDDNLVLTQNKHVQAGVTGISKLLTTNYAHGHQSFNDGLYRPVSLISFAIEKSLFNLDPKASHLFQVIWFGLLLLGLGLFLQKLFPKQRYMAFWIALLFALHPIHTEVVANLKSRDEIFGLLFFSFSAYFFLQWLEKQRIKDLMLALSLYTMALFSKESAITLLPAFGMIAWMKIPTSNKGVMLSLKSGGLFLIPTLLFLGVRQLVLNQLSEVDGGVSSLLQNTLIENDTIVQRIFTGAEIQGLYLQKLLFPVGLSHDYSYNAIPLADLSSPGAWIWLVFVLLAIIMGVRSLIKREWWGFATVFYFMTLSVVANVFILIGAMAAERFVFTPSLGFIILIVLGINSLPKLAFKRANLILIGIAVSYAMLSFQRIPDWESNYTLFKADVDKVAESARAHYNYGSALTDQAKLAPQQRQSMYAEAVEHLNKAIEIWPDYQDAYNNLGVVYTETKDFEAAREVYTNLTKQFPDYSKAYYNLGLVCSRMELWAEAETSYERYFELAPDKDVLFLLADIEGNQGKFDEAIAHLEQLSRMEPNRPRSLLKIGTAYAIQGNESEAERIYLAAEKVAPRNAEVQFSLALVYLNTGRAELAVGRLERCLDLNPNHERAPSLLAELRK